MEEIIAQVLREFYETGVPSDVCQRPFDYLEKKRNATSIIGMRRTGKTYAAYQRMLELMNEGIPLEQIVYVNRDMDSTFVHGKVHRRRYLLKNKIRWNDNLTIHEDSYFNILCQNLTENAKYCPFPFYL